jgi:hypothetical protein
MRAITTVVCLALVATIAAPRGSATPEVTTIVATKDSSDHSKAAAQFVGDGVGDQDEINAAIRSLPPSGGTVLLMEGTYDIRRVAARLGGVLIERSNVVLAGQGPGTRLVQAPGQDTNVIRIIGPGVGQIVIRDLAVDANRDQNSHGTGDPNVSHGRFEFCGIKAFCAVPGGSGEDCHDITIRNTSVLNAFSLGIMMEGRNLKVVDNTIGNAGSDAVELLTGPGEIRGNYFNITGSTGVAVGSDRANSIIMANNIVHVRKGGSLEIGFRTWAGSHRHVISNNVLTVDPGGRCTDAMDIRGEGAIVIGNNVHAASTVAPMQLLITGGNTLVTGNCFENVAVKVDDTSGTTKPILFQGNLLEHSTVEHRAGRLITCSTNGEPPRHRGAAAAKERGKSAPPVRIRRSGSPGRQPSVSTGPNARNAIARPAGTSAQP